MKSHLLEDKLAEGSFDAHGQGLVAGKLIVGTLSDCCAQISIITGENDLQEVVIVEQSV